MWLGWCHTDCGGTWGCKKVPSFGLWVRLGLEWALLLGSVVRLTPTAWGHQGWGPHCCTYGDMSKYDRIEDLPLSCDWYTNRIGELLNAFWALCTFCSEVVERSSMDWNLLSWGKIIQTYSCRCHTFPCSLFI